MQCFKTPSAFFFLQLTMHNSPQNQLTIDLPAFLNLQTNHKHFHNPCTLTLLEEGEKVITKPHMLHSVATWTNTYSTLCYGKSTSPLPHLLSTSLLFRLEGTVTIAQGTYMQFLNVRRAVNTMLL